MKISQPVLADHKIRQDDLPGLGFNRAAPGSNGDFAWIAMRKRLAIEHGGGCGIDQETHFCFCASHGDFNDRKTVTAIQMNFFSNSKTRGCKGQEEKQAERETAGHWGPPDQ